MKIITFIIFILARLVMVSQTYNYTINGSRFLVKRSITNNEWGTNDSIASLYNVSELDSIYLFDFYIYQDQGGDCNNRYWKREKLEVNNGCLILLTHYFQLEGINDPIPEWRKQIYQVEVNGRLNLIFDKYKYFNSDSWVTY